MTTVSEYFEEHQFRSFERRPFGTEDYYAVEPDCWDDGLTQSRLYVRGTDAVRQSGAAVLAPLYLAEWSLGDDPSVSPCRSLTREEYRALDLTYFVNFPAPVLTYEEADGKWRIVETGEYRYQGESLSRSDDVQEFLALGFAPSRLEWTRALLAAEDPDEPAVCLLTGKYFPKEEFEPF